MGVAVVRSVAVILSLKSRFLSWIYPENTLKNDMILQRLFQLVPGQYDITFFCRWRTRRMLCGAGTGTRTCTGSQETSFSLSGNPMLAPSKATNDEDNVKETLSFSPTMKHLFTDNALVRRKIRCCDMLERKNIDVLGNRISSRLRNLPTLTVSRNQTEPDSP